MIIRNFYDSKLAQASYLIGCSATGEAIVIDPARDVLQYLEMAESLSLRIVAATETHIHADFLSGTRELSASTGATMYLSGEGGEEWQYAYANDHMVVLLHDGDLIRIGNLTLRVIHTPGHTPEHICFLLKDHPTSEMAHSLFSGDFVFAGDVGRPDLLERAASIAGTMQEGARDQHRSLKKLRDLSDSLLLWPGHGAGSSCGKALGGSPVTSLGYERATNWAFLVQDEERFVDEILSGQPEPPLYFKEMKRMNKQGPALRPKLDHVETLSATAGQIIDIRDAESIRAGSYADAIAVPAGTSFTGWAGWVVRYDEPVCFIAESQQAADAAARDLASIGLDSVAGWIHPRDLDKGNFAPIEPISTSEVPDDALVLDVRSTSERTVSHIPGSVHIPFGHLLGRLSELPRDREIVVHCQSGRRSVIACSILLKGGFRHVKELPGGMISIEAETPQLVCRA